MVSWLMQLFFHTPGVTQTSQRAYAVENNMADGIESKLNALWKSSVSEEDSSVEYDENIFFMPWFYIHTSFADK